MTGVVLVTMVNFEIN